MTKHKLRDELGHWIGFLLNVTRIANEFYQGGDTKYYQVGYRWKFDSLVYLNLINNYLKLMFDVTQTTTFIF